MPRCPAPGQRTSTTHARAPTRPRRVELRERAAPGSRDERVVPGPQDFVETLFAAQDNRDDVGAFEGANYASQGMYRSQMNCLMFTRTEIFCAVLRCGHWRNHRSVQPPGAAGCADALSAAAGQRRRTAPLPSPESRPISPCRGYNRRAVPLQLCRHARTPARLAPDCAPVPVNFEVNSGSSHANRSDRCIADQSRATIFMGGSAGTFVNGPSLVVVLVGTLLVCMIKFSMGQFLSATKIAVKAFTDKVRGPDEIIAKSVELAKAARQSGILALEEADVPDPFMKKGINLLIDGYDSDVVKKMLFDDVRLTVQRHRKRTGDIQGHRRRRPGDGHDRHAHRPGTDAVEHGRPETDRPGHGRRPADDAVRRNPGQHVCTAGRGQTGRCAARRKTASR